MIHRFLTTAETAHTLTTMGKREHFYFRPLTQTDQAGLVCCETTDRGATLIKNKGFKVNFY